MAARNDGGEAIKTAIKICTMFDFKQDVLEVPGRQEYVENDVGEMVSFKMHWNDRIERCISNYFKNNPSEENQAEKVTGIVFSIAFRLLTWVEYHVETFDFDIDFCLSLLTPDMFTQEGIIDYTKTKELFEKGGLNDEQTFLLGSWHCLKKRCAIFNELEEDKFYYYGENPDDIHQPPIVKYWAYYLMGEINVLKDRKQKIEVGYPGNRFVMGDPEEVNNPLRTLKLEEYIEEGTKPLDQFRLECALTSGSKTAIEHCVERISEKHKAKPDILLDTLIGVVYHRVKLGIDARDRDKDVVDDWVVFKSPKYSRKYTWVPSHFLVDIFYSIFNRLTPEEKSRLAPKLKDAIHNSYEVRTAHEKQLFDYFLCWPYQNQLMEFANLCWKHIPYDYYKLLLFSIFERVDPVPDSLYYGADKAFDYEKLFVEFLGNSPDNFKRDVFKDESVIVLSDRTKVRNLGRELLLRMIIKNSPSIDRITKYLLASASPYERKSFLYSSHGSQSCDFLMRKNKFDFLDELINKCIESADESRKFRGKLDILEPCFNLIKVGNFRDAANAFKTLQLNETEVSEVKEKIILSVKGVQLLTQRGFESSEKFVALVNWCALTARKRKDLSDRLLERYGKEKCLNGSIEAPEAANRFLVLSHSLSDPNPERVETCVRQFKHNLAYNEGIFYIKLLVYGALSNIKLMPLEDVKTRIDSFLTWALSETDIGRYKRELLNHHSDLDFHYRFVQSNRFQDALDFYRWAGFSMDEIKDERKYLLFRCQRTAELFSNAMILKEVPAARDTHIEFIGDFLRWCLVDRESIVKFYSKFFWYKNDPIIQYAIDGIIAGLSEQR